MCVLHMLAADRVIFACCTVVVLRQQSGQLDKQYEVFSEAVDWELLAVQLNGFDVVSQELTLVRTLTCAANVRGL